MDGGSRGAGALAGPLAQVTAKAIPAVMQAIEYCLPFVFVRKPCGRTMTLDTRRYALVQTSEQFGNAVFAAAKRLRREAERKEKRAKKTAKS